jgi:membrane protease YdiL (CAAX protease family)
MTVTAPSPVIHRFVLLAFWVALTFAVTMALLPKPPHLPIDGFGDKFEHMLAFATLTVLGSFAFPAMPRWRLAERLSFLGALIEVLQSIPALHRDCDIRDWIADTLAIVIVTGLVALGRNYAAHR